jgi:hypothetical protein
MDAERTSLDTVADAQQPQDPQSGPRRLRWWREVLYGVVIYFVYSLVRNNFGSASGDPVPAYENALQIIRIQEAMGLYFERGLQSWYLDLPANGLIRAWNVFYGIAHFVVTIGALVWLYRRGPERYPLWRNTLAFTTGLAIIGFAAYSLMPPRLLDDPGRFGGCQVYLDEDVPHEVGASVDDPAACDRHGFVDTIDEYGGWASFGSDEMAAVSNQYAAMPSMHIGWSTWSALVLVPLVRRRWAKALAAAYPAITLFCIIVTGNHFWLDAVGGWACLGVGFLVAGAVTRAVHRYRNPSRLSVDRR